MRPFSVVVPVYNEEAGIKKFLDSLLDFKKTEKWNCEIIIINDGSRDKSGEVLASYKDVRVLTHRENKGYGAALKTAILAAKHEHIIIIDADGTYPIDKISEFNEELTEYDMIVGSRNGKNVNIPLIRRPAKKFINVLTNYLSGKKIPDLNSGLRGFRKSIVLNYFHVLPDQFSFTSTITVSMLAEGYRVGFIPIDYHLRSGKSKIKPKHFFSFLTLVLRIVYLFNPMRFFLILTTILFSYASLKALHDVLFVGFLSASTIIFYILSAQSLFFGVVLDVMHFLNFRKRQNFTNGTLD
ncbi:MAG: glycosyltransferase family 2 protein [Ignavibacteria bacterium]|nr:glycosyltransferase family 2 protein [Ignavibacteria bacterium]